MAEYTANYDLEKQQANEYIRIEGLNENFDKIDTEINKLQKETTYAETTLSQDKTIFSSGTGKDSVGIEQNYSDIVEGQSTVKLEGFTAQNLVKNGDFSDGINGWFVNGVSTVTDQTLSYVLGEKFEKAFQKMKFISENIYYGAADVKATSNLIKLNIQRQAGYDTLLKAHSGSGNFERLSVRGSIGIVGSNPMLSIMDFRDSGWDNIYVRNVICINLTATFGAGNEPTKEQCDIMFDHYFDGLQGVGNHKIVSRGKNLFKITDHAFADGCLINSNSFRIYRNATYTTSELFKVKLKPNTNYVLKYEVSLGGNAAGVYNDTYSTTSGSALIPPITGGTDTNQYHLFHLMMVWLVSVSTE